MKNATKVLIVLAACVLLMWIPVTRSIILFLLPLGSGVDDLIFFALLGALIVFFLFWWNHTGVKPAQKIKEWLKGEQDNG